MKEVAEILEKIPSNVERIRRELAKKIYGQEKLIELLLAGILSRGHCLLTGVPGLAKTLLASTLAEIAELDFKRVQFTPDMMPGDITGSEILEVDRVTGERVFKFMPGPVFTQLLLADEINRTTPKTQATIPCSASSSNEASSTPNSFLPGSFCPHPRTALPHTNPCKAAPTPKKQCSNCGNDAGESYTHWIECFDAVPIRFSLEWHCNPSPTPTNCPESFASPPICQKSGLFSPSRCDRKSLRSC